MSEATEQGEALRHTALESELSLINGPASDEVLTPPNFERENTLWEQTVDLVTQTQNAADQLRGPSALGDDEDEPSEREPETGDGLEFDPNASDIRELSLLDRASENGDEDETISPDIEAEDGGRHARTTPSHELGAQVEGSPGPNTSPASSTAERKLAAASGSLAALWERTARATLMRLARALRWLAHT